ncbi:hypothetical protein [Aeromicrobium sp. UC242_57]|uniref:hypothetical protein n=1 Tax=Aeromicrobium sp. UC242_57 TaxID=3374624 RepID=UPI0037AF5403
MPRLAQAGERRWVRVAVAVVLGAVSVAATFIPALETGGLRWLPFALVLPAALWCAWPIHRSAIRSVASGRPNPDLIATTGIVAALGWSAHAVAHHHSGAHLIPVAVTSILVVASEAISPASDVAPYVGVPRWLAPVVLVIAAITVAIWWSIDNSASAALSVLLVTAPGRCASPHQRHT